MQVFLDPLILESDLGLSDRLEVSECSRNSRRVERRMPKQARWNRPYEEDEDFQLWFDNLARE